MNEFDAAEFNKLSHLTSIVLSILGLVLCFKIIGMEDYQLRLEMDLQTAEHDRATYRETIIDLKQENYILYDQLRQIDANREAQEALRADGIEDSEG